jgi:hypothetical protein
MSMRLQEEAPMANQGVKPGTFPRWEPYPKLERRRVQDNMVMAMEQGSWRAKPDGMIFSLPPNHQSCSLIPDAL